MPFLRKHQIREGENLSKINLEEDDDNIPHAAISNADTEQSILANSVEQEKFLMQQKDAQV